MHMQESLPSAIVVKKKAKPTFIPTPTPIPAKPQRILPTPEEKAAKQVAHLDRIRHQRWDAYQRYLTSCRMILQVMGERWPVIFAPDADTRPLALGIDAEIIAALPEFSKRRVRHALAYFFRLPTIWHVYQSLLAAGGPRYDLDGNECGVITAEEQATARVALLTTGAQRQEAA